MVAFFVFVVQKFWPGDAAADLADSQSDSESEQEAAIEPTYESGSSSSNSPPIPTAAVRRSNVKRTVLQPQLVTAGITDQRVLSNAPFYARFWRHILYNWKVGDKRTKALYLMCLYCVVSFCILFIVEMIGTHAIVKNIDTAWDNCETEKKRERDNNGTPITNEDIRRICSNMYEDDYIAAEKNSRTTHCLWNAATTTPILSKIRRVVVRTISQMTEQDGLVLGVILPFIVLPIVLYKLAQMIFFPAAPAKKKKNF
jgi:hypothetical protein